jgi:hypothetical protein
VNAHHAGECRQGSIPELQRGQVSMRLENKTRTTSQYGDPWRVRGAATYKMSLERRSVVAGLVPATPIIFAVNRDPRDKPADDNRRARRTLSRLFESQRSERPRLSSVLPSRVTSEKPTLPLCTQAAPGKAARLGKSVSVRRSA